jgi:hypothetical protein
VRLFFDEDQGKGVASALHAVGIQSDYVGPSRRIRKNTSDEDWIPIIGARGDLVISSNKAILTTESQRDLWIAHRLGGVFFTTNQIRAIDRLKLLLRKLSWLEQIDSEGRPFAWYLSPTGAIRRAPEIPLND